MLDEELIVRFIPQKTVQTFFFRIRTNSFGIFRRKADVSFVLHGFDRGLDNRFYCKLNYE